jgi:hypothetical protein
VQKLKKNNGRVDKRRVKTQSPPERREVQILRGYKTRARAEATSNKPPR